MKGVIVHGILLAVMLLVGYQTWTRDKSVAPEVGSVEVWNRPVADLQSITYQSSRKKVVIERRGQGAGAYWWGIETRYDKRLKQIGMDAGVAATAQDGGTAVATATGDAGAAAATTAGDGGLAELTKAMPEEEIITDTTEFPVGETGDDLVKGVSQLKVLRALGAVKDDAKKEYGLVGVDTTLQITFKDGTHTFQIGDRIQGGKERYVLDPDSKKVYVLSGVFIDPLEGGAYQLRPNDPKGFDPADLGGVEVVAAGKSKKAVRITTTTDRGDQTKAWADPSTKKPNQTLANFIDNVDRLRPTKYRMDLKPADLKPVVTVTYLSTQDKKLATLRLFKLDHPAEVPADGSADPTQLPPMVTDYYMLTERMRVPAEVPRGSAERIEQDVPTLLQ